jgi:hypothetical protein
MQNSIDNPYRAPQAAVEDFMPEEDRGERPEEATRAVALLWITLVIQAAGLAFIWRLFRLFGLSDYIVAGIITATWVINAFLVAMIERGRNWARITALVLYLLALPFLAMSIIATWKVSTLAAGSGALQMILQTIAMVMLFGRASREWFRGGSR